MTKKPDDPTKDRDFLKVVQTFLHTKPQPRKKSAAKTSQKRSKAKTKKEG